MKKSALLLVAISACFAYTRAEQPAAIVRDSGGVADCKRCHRTPDADYEKKPAERLIRMTESALWESEDPHSKAYEALSGELGKRMQSALGFDVTQDTRCLTCHAVDYEPRSHADPNVKPRFVIDFGVSCEACHGNRDDKWYSLHSQKPWRSTLPSEKEKQGQNDLRDPVIRAAKCASCHVGNIKEGKFVSHEMYAAGHPPLAPFEPVTFGRDQPRHWDLPETIQYLNDGISEEKAWELFHYRRGESSIARSLVLGNVATVRVATQLLADGAEQSSKNGTLLDFAHFDCFACHHDLETPSQRQLRGYQMLVPGRPPMQSMRTELIAAFTESLSPSNVNVLASQFADLRRAVDERPFGNLPAVQVAATSTVDKLKQLEADLSQLRFANELVLKALVAKSPAIWDFDAAQHMTWAVRALSAYETPNSDLLTLEPFVMVSAGIKPKSSFHEMMTERLRKRNAFSSPEFDVRWRELRNQFQK